MSPEPLPKPSAAKARMLWSVTRGQRGRYLLIGVEHGMHQAGFKLGGRDVLAGFQAGAHAALIERGDVAALRHGCTSAFL